MKTVKGAKLKKLGHPKDKEGSSPRTKKKPQTKMTELAQSCQQVVNALPNALLYETVYLDGNYIGQEEEEVIRYICANLSRDVAEKYFGNIVDYAAKRNVKEFGNGVTVHGKVIHVEDRVVNRLKQAIFTDNLWK